MRELWPDKKRLAGHLRHSRQSIETRFYVRELIPLWTVHKNWIKCNEVEQNSKATMLCFHKDFEEL